MSSDLKFLDRFMKEFVVHYWIFQGCNVACMGVGLWAIYWTWPTPWWFMAFMVLYISFHGFLFTQMWGGLENSKRLHLKIRRELEHEGQA